MFMNFKELTNWLDKRLNSYYIDKKIVKESYTPFKYKGIYEGIGYVTIWNDFGGIEYEFKMFKPVNGGTVVYEVI